jgi:hypothetical protein
LIADAGDDDIAGTFVIEFEPTHAPGDLTRIDGLIYDLDTAGGC